MKYLKNYEKFKNVNEYITIIRDFFNHFQKNDEVIFDPPIEIIDENLFRFKNLYLNEDDELSFSIGVEQTDDNEFDDNEFDDNELLIGINEDFLKKICEELYNRKEYEVYFEADKFGL